MYTLVCFSGRCLTSAAELESGQNRCLQDSGIQAGRILLDLIVTLFKLYKPCFSRKDIHFDVCSKKCAIYHVRLLFMYCDSNK